MDLRIKTDIAEEVLSTDDVSQFIKFEDEDNAAELSLISGMIAAVRTHFERRTGLSFASRTYEILFHYYDKPYILPVEPIISVDKVEIVDYLGVKEELTLNSGYFKKGLYQVEIETSYMTSGGYYDLLVTFKAGFGNAATEDLPADLKDAMMKQIKQWYDNRDDFYEFKILGSIEKVLNLYKTKLL